MTAETNTVATKIRHGRAAREGEGSPAPGRESPVRKADDGRLIVKCPRCKLNTKFAREEIPKD